MKRYNHWLFSIAPLSAIILCINIFVSWFIHSTNTATILCINLLLIMVLGISIRHVLLNFKTAKL